MRPNYYLIIHFNELIKNFSIKEDVLEFIFINEKNEEFRLIRKNQDDICILEKIF